MRSRTCLVLFVALAAFPLAAATTAGCSTEVVYLSDAPDAAVPDDDDFVFIDAGRDAWSPFPDASTKDALPDYEDPGCTDQPEPIYDFLCDPYDQASADCFAEEACYIYVDYPSEPCGQEIYGSYCYPAGSGQQGSFCNGGLDCAAGFVCVISGSGNQCIELCSLTGPSGCPSGLVCEPIDVEGFGGCL